MGVIQAELDRVAHQHNVESVPGRPETFFFLPELEGNFINHRFT